MIAFPPCKINLGLYITEKRDDGFHNLETCFYPVPFSDILEIIPGAEFAFSSSGLSIPGNSSDNLCVKAYQLLKDKFNLPHVRIHLHKVIPTGAGLGGGSADAAYTLRLLNNIFSLDLAKEMLMEYAAQLGSDCSFFINDEAMIGTGRGEILNPCSIDLAGKYLVLVKPDIHVSTAEAYRGITSSKYYGRLKETIEHVPVGEWRGNLRNDFEESVFRRYPFIGELRDELYQLGAMYACMSGSGSTVAGLFDKAVPFSTVRKANVLWKDFLPSLSSAS
jgi:4-diphosphocytidyl-2-C-methyl-D-erythritol kinase